MQWSQTKPSTEFILGEQWQEVILSQNEYETASWSFSKITFWLRYILTSLREQPRAIVFEGLLSSSLTI